MENKKHYMICGIIGLTLCFLYLIGTGDMDYSYYQFLRIISLILIPIFISIYGWFIKESERVLDFVNVPTGIILILFNPIKPMYFDKETWIILDVICAIVFFAIDIYIVFLYIRAKKENEKKPIIINLSDAEWENLYKTNFEVFWEMVVNEADLTKLPNHISEIRNGESLYGEDARNYYLDHLKRCVYPSKFSCDIQWAALLQIKLELEKKNQPISMLDIIKEYNHHIKY